MTDRVGINHSGEGNSTTKSALEPAVSKNALEEVRQGKTQELEQIRRREINVKNFEDEA